MKIFEEHKTEIYLILVVMLIFFTIMYVSMAFAHDSSGRVHTTPELNDWFNGLSSSKGHCCSNNDGTSIDDDSWESKDGHYIVRINNKWVEVPDEAVLRIPNKAGRTMVWFTERDSLIIIRCFIPGTMV
jgi:hypothetical protein